MDTIDRILEQKNEQIKQLEEENKKLNERIKELENELMEDMKTETELEERIRFLEQCLDNKEKVNKSMREELEWYHGFDNYLTNHGFDMKKLKEKDYAKQCGVDLDE